MTDIDTGSIKTRIMAEVESVVDSDLNVLKGLELMDIEDIEVREMTHESADLAWCRLVGVCIDSDQPIYPSNRHEIKDLLTACVILQLGDDEDIEGYVSDDSGLWEGLQGQQVIFCQAYFTLESIIYEKFLNEVEKYSDEVYEALIDW